MSSKKILISGNQAVALGAYHANIQLGVGYPGTPSSEILDAFSQLGGNAEWAPNEKVAVEVGLGVAFGKGRALATMKHVGLNVAADVLYTMTLSGVQGAYVLAVADDPGMASSQNEQDTRRHAFASGCPVLEPSNSQEAYDFTKLAFVLSQRFQIPFILRLTTRVSHSTTVVEHNNDFAENANPAFVRNIQHRVMVPGHARPAHKRLREKLHLMESWNNSEGPWKLEMKKTSLGIISSGVAYEHCREAAPDASILKLGMVNPLPMAVILKFIDSVDRCIVIEENDPFLLEQIRTHGGKVEQAAEIYRFGELNVSRVKRLLSGNDTPEPAPAKGRPPQLCVGCPHRFVFDVLKKLDCIVAGDIGCYTLGALPPYQAMDAQICMGASVGMGCGLRHTLPEKEARRVVSVIGDGTFVHSGMTGMVEMAYNKPATGHILMILDNATTAMTGQQEHPGTGRTLNHEDANIKLDYKKIAQAIGIDHIYTIDPMKEQDLLEETLIKSMASNDLTLIIAKRPCILELKNMARRK